MTHSDDSLGLLEFGGVAVPAGLHVLDAPRRAWLQITSRKSRYIAAMHRVLSLLLPLLPPLLLPLPVAAAAAAAATTTRGRRLIFDHPVEVVTFHDVDRSTAAGSASLLATAAAIPRRWWAETAAGALAVPGGGSGGSGGVCGVCVGLVADVRRHLLQHLPGEGAAGACTPQRYRPTQPQRRRTRERRAAAAPVAASIATRALQQQRGRWRRGVVGTATMAKGGRGSGGCGGGGGGGVKLLPQGCLGGCSSCRRLASASDCDEEDEEEDDHNNEERRQAAHQEEQQRRDALLSVVSTASEWSTDVKPWKMKIFYCRVHTERYEERYKKLLEKEKNAARRFSGGRASPNLGSSWGPHKAWVERDVGR